MKKILLAIYISILTVSAISAQTNHSDSRPYEPRRFTEPDGYKPNIRKKNSDVPKVDSDELKNTDSKIVRIPVMVFDRSDSPINDLKGSDFKVFADNAEQEIAAFETAKSGRNFMVVIDTSPSFSLKDDDLKKFVGEMVKALKPEDKMQLIRFNQTPEVLCEPTNDPKILQKAIKQLKMGDGTSLYDSMQIIYRKYLKNVAEKPIIILVTDGVDTTSQRTDYFSSLLIAEENDALVFPFYYDTFQDFSKRPVLVGLPVPGLPFPRRAQAMTKEEYAIGRYYLQDIAELSGGKTFNIDNFKEVKKEDFDNVFEVIRPMYYLSIKQPANEKAGQRKQLKVSVNRPNLNVMARGSFITGAN